MKKCLKLSIVIFIHYIVMTLCPLYAAHLFPVKVVKIYSLSCHGCHKFMKDEFPEIKEKLVDTGKIIIENVEFINDLSTLIATKIAHSMGPEKYQEFVDILLERQDEWHVDGQWKEKLRDIALNDLKISQTLIDDCFKRKTPSETHLYERQADIIEQYNLQFVPAFIIHGRVIRASLKDLEDALDKGPIDMPIHQ